MEKTVMLSDIAEDRPTEVEVGGEAVILVRDGAEVRAFAGKCPHAGAPLAKGAVCGGRIVCPWHKAMFDVRDGALLEPPALDGLASYRTEVRDGAVYVDPAPQQRAAPKPAADDRHVVIIGTGAAGAAAASALREFGFGGAITMVGREPDPPYDRTALSKFVLEGGKAPEEVQPLRPEEFYAKHRIERVIGDVAEIDPAAKRIRLAAGQTLGFTETIIASGATPNVPKLPGADLPGVFTLRSKLDAARIVGAAKKGGQAVLLGSSFIGLEAASALRKRGLKVDVVTPEAVPFLKQFGERIGQMFLDLHKKNGVRFHPEAKAVRIEPGTVMLEDGTVLPADLVLMGIGVHPVSDFAQALGRTEDGGIVVDSGMQAAPGIYAAGDVARFPWHDAPTRIEHWRVAEQHGRVAARNIAGGQAAFDSVPFFWTYHYGKRFEYLGHATRWDEVVIEGSLEEQKFVALLVDGGRVAGVVACGQERATCKLIEKMRAGLELEGARRLIQESDA